MKLHTLAALAAAVAVIAIAPAGAQTTTKTQVSTSSTMKDGMPAQKVKVVHVRKTKTHRPKRVLGVKVGHKTMVHKTVKETTTAANGDTTTQVKNVRK